MDREIISSLILGIVFVVIYFGIMLYMRYSQKQNFDEGDD